MATDEEFYSEYDIHRQWLMGIELGLERAIAALRLKAGEVYAADSGNDDRAQWYRGAARDLTNKELNDTFKLRDEVEQHHAKEAHAKEAQDTEPDDPDSDLS